MLRTIRFQNDKTVKYEFKCNKCHHITMYDIESIVIKENGDIIVDMDEIPMGTCESCYSRETVEFKEKEESKKRHAKNLDIKEWDFVGPLVREDVDRYRMKGYQFILTYDGHIPKSELVNYFKNKFLKIAKILAAHENGFKGIYPHTHLIIEFVENIDWGSRTKFDWKMRNKTIHPSIRKINSDNWVLAVKMMGAEDPENEHLDDI